MATKKQIQQKAWREERKIIESKLHPCPKIDGIDILHEHRGKQIIFSAWKGNDQLNNRYISIDRLLALYSTGSYVLVQSEINYLLGK